MKNKEVLFFEYVTLFLDTYLTKQCGKSYNTVESYRDSLTVFRKYIFEIKHVSVRKFYMIDCTKEFVLEFIQYLREKNRKASTINRHISTIKSYLWYVSDINIKYQGLAISISHIPTFRLQKSEKECLDDESLHRLFSAPKNTKKGIRDRTIMILLYEMAVRIGELLNIKLEDIHIGHHEPYILIHGKGDKERVVALSEKALEHLKMYNLIFHKNNESNYLFYNTIKGVTAPLSESTVETFIQKYADQVRLEYTNIPKKVHPHMFRRSRATHLYQDGIPLELISRMLGHSNMETTKIYAKPSIEMLRRAMENENDISIQKAWDDEDEIIKLFGLR